MGFAMSLTGRAPSTRFAHASALPARPLTIRVSLVKILHPAADKTKGAGSPAANFCEHKVAMKLKLSAGPAVCLSLRVAMRATFLLGLATLTAAPAWAQLAAVGATKPLFAPGHILIGNDVSYDPAHGVYLLVAGYGEQYGIFVNQAGDPVAPAFRIGSASSGGAFGHYPRSEYSPDVNGGKGGFLVTWHQSGGLNAVIVAYPTGVISAERLVSDFALGHTRSGGGTGIAYSSTSDRFLVAWTTDGVQPFGIQGRVLDTSGAPVGPVVQIANPFGAADPSVAWNPATDEFAVFYSGFSDSGASVTLKRLRASDGGFQGLPTTFGFTGGTFSTEIAVNTSNNHYVVGWSIAPGAMGAELDESGNLLGAPRLLSSRMGTPTSMGLAFNPVSGTFLAVSEGTVGVDAVAVELDGAGVPKTAAITATSGARNGSFVPRVTARTDAKEWNISFARDLSVLSNQVIATGSTGTPRRAAAPPDITVWRPSQGTWFSLIGGTTWTPATPVRWGFPDDVPLRADFDGDGRSELVNYARDTGKWSVLFSSRSFSYDFAAEYGWGAPGDVPIPADFSGDGRTDLAVWRPSNGTWYIYDLASSTFTSRQWGAVGDVPITGDFDRDGKADVVIYRPSNGYWYVISSSTQTYAVYQWGISTDIPLPGDYTGDGRTDLAVYRPATGYWYIYDLVSRTYSGYQWGLPTDIPVPRDYSGDGRMDLAVWRPSAGIFYIYSLATGGFAAITHGAPGDMPVK
jgi:hypothetical protein